MCIAFAEERRTFVFFTPKRASFRGTHRTPTDITRARCQFFCALRGASAMKRTFESATMPRAGVGHLSLRRALRQEPSVHQPLCCTTVRRQPNQASCCPLSSRSTRHFGGRARQLQKRHHCGRIKCACEGPRTLPSCDGDCRDAGGQKTTYRTPGPSAPQVGCIR